jgi:hypothetical protein
MRKKKKKKKKKIKSRMMSWTWHIARMGELRNAYKILFENHGEDLGVNGKIILEWIFGKWGGKLWTGCLWLRIWTSGGLL